MKSEAVIQNNQIMVEGLPKPHTCPWLMQYVFVSPLRRLLEPPEKLVGPFVRPGMTVVEPGCGFGFVSMELARLVGEKGKVISVDLEPRAVERLEERARKAGLAGRMELRSCEPRDLGLADFEGLVDLIAVIHTLHEFEDLPGFLAQAAALLKPSGRLLVVEPKGHVRPASFQAELECCKLAGFGVLETPEMGKRRMAALLAPPLTWRSP
jgi:SAM-dependent methyltransferase